MVPLLIKLQSRICICQKMCGIATLFYILEWRKIWLYSDFPSMKQNCWSVVSHSYLELLFPWADAAEISSVNSRNCGVGPHHEQSQILQRWGVCAFTTEGFPFCLHRMHAKDSLPQSAQLGWPDWLQWLKRLLPLDPSTLPPLLPQLHHHHHHHLHCSATSPRWPWLLFIFHCLMTNDITQRALLASAPVTDIIALKLFQSVVKSCKSHKCHERVERKCY
jgi:hypothetical protein